MAPAELTAWLRLLQTPGLGREGVRRLLATFGSPEAVLEASDEALTACAGPALAPLLRNESPDLPTLSAAIRRWLHGAPQRHLLALGDTAYPTALLESPDPPLLLYVQGRLDLLATPGIAMVGSRQPTPQGRDLAHDFARQFGVAGYTVVSGLALGIDGAAHEGALAAGAPTIAVLGTGLDVSYPARHADLARRISAQGALVSEFAPGTPPRAAHFPQRNRIIAGLSQGTLVVEAALKSGSLITARLANEAGREVFALPGSVLSPQSRGCHALIRDGARLVETADEVLSELRQPALPGLARLAAAAPAPAPASGTGDPLLAALGHAPTSLDTLQARTGWPTAELLARLLELELEGHVAHLPGGLYQRRSLA
ncbi:DNA-processing protein DprA [Pseudorhodoferax sp.]|uniref:DNA-processing protein DprA n=1 Tax=Pseudorhodoferax sp. TaxID=1993553 RepID=UPI002DD61C61|nr:DNA-processing protein DprA [Pseudorhodoferax sp.]